MSLPKTVVLVVESHPIVRACMTGSLVEAGFDALDVGGASEAIALLEARSDIRLVFTETDIPETMDGLRLARCIRDRWPPVMLIVASGRPGVVGGSLPAGTKFFPKPYHVTTVVEAVAGMYSPAEAPSFATFPRH